VQFVSRARVVSLVVALSVLAAACASTPPPKPVVAVKPPDSTDLKGASAYVAQDLSTQLGQARARRVVLDPLLDRASGQQTAASLRVQQELLAALTAAMPGLVIEPLDEKAADQTGLVATGTVSTVTAPDQFLMRVALTDRATTVVVAQSAAHFQQADMNQTPTAFYSDSPSLVRDRSVDGYLKTSETAAGSLADPLYVEQLPTAAVLASALVQYNEGHWDAALAGYTAAAARADGQNLRTFNGLYLTNMHLGRTAAAEDAFGKIATLGLGTNNLAVKLLFRPGTTEFLADPSFGGVYPMWIRQIARTAGASQVCLNITGHTSASGTAAVNDRLSLARATAVQALLERESAGLKPRLRVTGVGSRRNMVGTGADDASDAIDRRVEFEVVACGG
jgi:outer membrane protein OmpA-like peptidoglycan-associated protein